MKPPKDPTVALVHGAINAELQDLTQWLDELVFVLADAFRDDPGADGYAGRPDDDVVYRTAVAVIDAVWNEVVDRGNLAGKREDAA